MGTLMVGMVGMPMARVRVALMRFVPGVLGSCYNVNLLAVLVILVSAVSGALTCLILAVLLVV